VDYEQWAGVIAGTSPLTWELWLSPISRSDHLTPQGMEAVHTLIGDLARFLGEDWLGRSRGTRDGSELLSLEWNPINNTVHVARNLLELGTQVKMVERCKRIREVRKTVQANPQQLSSTLQQIEIANLAARVGFAVRFEPALDSGKLADVEIRNEDGTQIIECTELGIDEDTVRVSDFAEKTLGRIRELARAHGVHVSATLARS